MPEPIRVLVVDDDFMVARIHCSYVGACAGFTVVGEAHTAAEVSAALADLDPDLVLLDLYLPDCDVEELLSSVLHAPGRHDVIVLSAANDAATVRSAFRGGAHHYLIKPFSRAELAGRLEDYRTQRLATARAVREDGTMGQHAVDDMFARPALLSPGQQLPKGLAVPTLQLVVAALHEARDRDDPSVSASECGAEVGIARVSARRYLEHLVATGHAHVAHRYGRSGRPERRYSLVGGRRRG